MNILAITNFRNLYSQNNLNCKKNVSNNYVSNFGIKARPELTRDTINFKASKQTTKAINDAVVKLPLATVKYVRKVYQTPHEYFIKHLKTCFGNIEAEGKISLGGRPKSNFSIIEKAQTLGITTKDEIFKNLDDISAGRIIVETEEGFEEVVKYFSKFIKKGKFKVVDFENHRLPSKHLGDGRYTNNDAFDSTKISRLKAIATNSNPILAPKDVDSPVGYSGIHITLEDENGFRHELQIITKAMFKVKEAEDLFYKIKAGKMLQPKYQNKLYPTLKVLRPIEDIEIISSDKKIIKQSVFKNTMNTAEPEILTEEMKELRKKVFKYTKDAYKFALNHPYSDRVLPAPDGLEKFDFARIFNEMLQCH